jgi:hypothetical protein
VNDEAKPDQTVADLDFVELPRTSKSRRWEVFATRSPGVGRLFLGTVAWTKRWYQYTYRPVPETEFTYKYLHAIADFCYAATQEQGQPRPLT